MLLRIVALLPLAGPAIAKALTKSACKPTVAYIPYVPADFPKWNKAIDGLEDAMGWAMEFERTQLPTDAVFPCVGEVWEATRDCQVDFFQVTVTFRNGRPFFPCGAASLKQGARVQVTELDGPKPLHVSFRPLRREQLQLPEHLKGFGHSELRLRLRTVRTPCCVDNKAIYFTEAFRLVEDVT
jgi:hypothetical protein